MKFLKGTLFYLADHLLLVGFLACTIAGWIGPAIGFLIAAKSVLRFGAVREEARLSEYVIIGTLASFGWAILMAIGTVMLLSALPPLGIPDLSP